MSGTSHPNMWHHIQENVTLHYVYLTMACFMFFQMYIKSDCSGTVVKALRYKSEGRWFDCRYCHWNFSLIEAFQLHYGPELDSASNRNEYQELFLGVKAAGA